MACIKSTLSFSLIILFFLMSHPTMAKESRALTDDLSHSIDSFILSKKATQRYSTNHQLSYELGSIDARLRLKPCTHRLDATPMQKNWLKRNSIFRFKCNQPRWSLTLPIKFSLHQPIWTTKRHLPKNHKITQQDIFLESIDILSSPFEYMSSDQNIVGYIAKRPIKLGSPIFAQEVIPAKIVYKHDNVDIVARGKAFQVRSKGVAMEDGYIGDQIKVKNNATNRILEAKIKTHGLVEILM